MPDKINSNYWRRAANRSREQAKNYLDLLHRNRHASDATRMAIARAVRRSTADVEKYTKWAEKFSKWEKEE